MLKKLEVAKVVCQIKTLTDFEYTNPPKYEAKMKWGYTLVYLNYFQTGAATTTVFVRVLIHIFGFVTEKLDYLCKLKTVCFF